MKTSAILLRITCWLFVISSGFAGDAGVLKESEVKEGARILGRLREIEREAELIEAELKRSTEVIVYALSDGEFRFLDAAAAKKDMDVLWYVLKEANAKSIGSTEIRREHPDTLVSAPLITALNEKIASHVRQKIAAIPGHAKVLGNRFERMSQEAGYFWRRREIMKCLELVGSMEAIQQIGRFLEDTRAPDLPAALVAIEASTDYLDEAVECRMSNASLAAHAMVRALGDASPARMHQGKILVEPSTDVVQAWWTTDAAKPYREWNSETGPIMPSKR